MVFDSCLELEGDLRQGGRSFRLGRLLDTGLPSSFGYSCAGKLVTKEMNAEMSTAFGEDGVE